MILVLIPIITCLGGVLAWILGRRNARACRWMSLAVLVADTILTLILWARVAHLGRGDSTTEPILLWQRPWIPQFGIGLSLAADGLTVLLLLLACVLGIVAVAVSWTEIQKRIGFFHFHLMLVLAGVMGVFLARDLFLFYVFWELMLVPMYFLISIWGHERRAYAAVKFFIFTQLGGLFMLLSILALYFIHGHETGDYTFDYQALLTTDLSATGAFWLMMGFVAAFFVKLPVIGMHTWLPDAHTEAPTAGSIILAGLLLKTGAYGLIRLVLPLFATSSRILAPVAIGLGAAGILYGAILAFGQKDLKRLIAYTSVSHLGFVLLGIFAGTPMALQGSIIIIIAHGLSTGGLFAVAGALQERLHTRQMSKLRGLWSKMPRMGGIALFFALASLGLPGLANFFGEFLVLAGSYATYPVATIAATSGLVASTTYSLWLIYRVFHGPASDASEIPDLCLREIATFGLMIALLVILGFWPQPVMDTAKLAFITSSSKAVNRDMDRATFSTSSLKLISRTSSDIR